MPNKREQKVSYEIVFGLDGEEIHRDIKGTNTGNLYSKLSKELREITIKYNLDEGALITIEISAVKEDNNERPLPE